MTAQAQPIPPETPQKIVEYDPVEAGLAVLREKYAGVVFDVSTTNGLQEARNARLEIREPRYECEKIRKRLKAPALEYSRRIDTEAARITAELEKLESPIDVVIKREEAAAEERREAKRRADMERQAELRNMVEAISHWPMLCLALTAQGIREAIARYEQHEIPSSPEIPPYYHHEATCAKARALTTLREMLDAQDAKEAEDARLAAERRAEDKRLREERQRLEEEGRRQEALRQQALREAAAERERAAEEWARVQRETREAEERLAEQRAVIERDQRARIAAERAREEPSVPWEASEPSRPPARSEPVEPPAPQEQAEPGTIVMRVRFEKLGGHYHCRVFTAPRPEVNFTKNGDLVFDEAEWPDIPLLMRGAEFIEESCGWP